MAYEIGFSQHRNSKLSTAVEPTAQGALKTVDGLKASDEVIRFIKAPWGGEIGYGELKMIAEQEAQKDA